MTKQEREALIQRVLKKYELYQLLGSRVKRVIKDPLTVLPFFALQAAAYIHPYKVTYTTLWGDTMRFYLPEGGMLYQYGFFEANLTNFLVRFLQEGDVFVDIGAHIGTYSVLASRLVGDTGKVFSFEPTPRTFATLRENMATKKNAHIENLAVLNNEETIEFYDYGPKYSAFNTFKKRTAKEISFKDTATKISVKTISLDKHAEKNNYRPTFIKIDAEGAEHVILSSMTGLFKNTKPVISIEVSNTEEWEENLRRSFNILQINGYESYEIQKDGMLRHCDPTVVRVYDNLIFAHPDAIQKTFKDLIL